MFYSNKDFSEDALKMLENLSVVAKRLSSAIRQKRDPIDALNTLEIQLLNLESELNKNLKEKNRVFLIQFMHNFYKINKNIVSVVMTDIGISEKLLSAVCDIILLIVKKINKTVRLVNIESPDGFELSCIIRDLNYDEIINTPLNKLICKIDGHIKKISDSVVEINIPNVFGKEKFLLVESGSGLLALPWTAVQNKNQITKDVYGKKQKIEMILGTKIETFLFSIKGIDESIRQTLQAPFDFDFFNGVFISTNGLPVPVINLSLLFTNKEKIECLL